MGYVITCNHMSTDCSVSSILRCLFIRWSILHKDPGSIANCGRAVDGVDSGIQHVIHDLAIILTSPTLGPQSITDLMRLCSVEVWRVTLSRVTRDISWIISNGFAVLFCKIFCNMGWCGDPGRTLVAVGGRWPQRFSIYPGLGWA